MFGFIKKGLEKTTQVIREVLPQKVKKIDKDTLEDVLLESDIPYEIVEEIIYYLPPSKMVKKDDVLVAIGIQNIVNLHEVSLNGS